MEFSSHRWTTWIQVLRELSVRPRDAPGQATNTLLDGTLICPALNCLNDLQSKQLVCESLSQVCLAMIT